jgi:acyl-CoA synthetase (AMP-forming)/AMP-acid ligase II
VAVTAAAYPDRPAVVDAASGQATSYAELAGSVITAADGWRQAGLRPADVIAVHAANIGRWPSAVLAVMAAGGTAALCSAYVTAEELAERLALVRPRVLLTTAGLEATARSAAAARVAVLDGERPFPAGPGRLPDDDRDAAARPAGLGEDPADEGGAVAVLPFSSGTSGRAKAVELTHRNLLAAGSIVRQVFDLRPGDRVLAVAPLAHVMGIGVSLPATLLSGACLVTLPRFTPDAFLRALARYQITHVVVPPAMLRLLATHPGVDGLDLSHLRMIAAGGAPVPAQWQTEVTRRLGCRVAQGYGLTETTGVIAISTGASDLGTCGRPCDGIEIRVTDPGTGAEAGPGESGELLVRGPTVMRGYLGDPAATAACLDAGGWLHTGDLVHLDPGEHLVVTDRLKELIKVNGFQVPPAELEQLLLTHPAVADAAVVGRPDPASGERPVAFIVPRHADSASASRTPGAHLGSELLDWLAPRISPYKRPAQIITIDAIPRNPAGKILRRVLRERVTATTAGAAAPA